MNLQTGERIVEAVVRHVRGGSTEGVCCALDNRSFSTVTKGVRTPRTGEQAAAQLVRSSAQRVRCVFERRRRAERATRFGTRFASHCHLLHPFRTAHVRSLHKSCLHLTAPSEAHRAHSAVMLSTHVAEVSSVGVPSTPETSRIAGPASRMRPCTAQTNSGRRQPGRLPSAPGSCLGSVARITQNAGYTLLDRSAYQTLFVVCCIVPNYSYRPTRGRNVTLRRMMASRADGRAVPAASLHWLPHPMVFALRTVSCHPHPFARAAETNRS